MRGLADVLRRNLPILVVIGLVVVGAVWMFGAGNGTKTVTAYFPRTVSVYEGSDVRVLGVSVGEVEQVVPEGTRVKVVLRYDNQVRVPADADAMIVSPSVVGDRFIQLSPAYTSGPVLADGATIAQSRTSVPLELDDIYDSIDRFSVALGPNGANKNGALSDLLAQTAKNFGGQGAAFRRTIEDFGDLSATLDDNKEELFGSAARLESFLQTLAENDQTVRSFNRSLGQVSSLLAGERQELTAALSNLGVALDQVSGFVQENRGALTRNIAGLDRVSKVLVKRRDELNQVLRDGPLAINNLALTYNPQAGTLDTNANLTNLVAESINNPQTVLCAIVSGADTNGSLCDLIKSLPLGRVSPFGTGSWTRDDYDPTLSGLVEVD
ncbi:MCE family protein [Nocardioides sp. GY 10113]|uniref:MCE family protein n=1 Tax=Nocardioides sp. GY 10113 TaxID=2569761 RepID=UPI0010A7FDDB|nr:MCE family protein [Nocardioides sp. GY 10113]TIC89327.1 MCE family protein [Nocardioides sp. GY 10113]